MANADPALASRLLRLSDGARRELLGGVAPFWLGLRDIERGGFFGQANSRGRAVRLAPKGSILQARILWFFSQAYLYFADPAFLQAAHWAYRFMADHLVDPEAGGVFWSVTAEGEPLDASKHLYAQAFAIYGLAAFHQASQAPEALDLAIRIRGFIERKAADPAGRGYRESFNRDWTPSPNDKMGRPDAPKSFNAHLHLLEAYGALWGVWPDRALRAQCEGLLALGAGRLLGPTGETFHQFFDSDFNPLDPGWSYGHDIEASWLIPAVAGLISPQTAAGLREATGRVARAVREKAQQPDGAVIMGLDVAGRLDRGKVWWVQAEALVGFLDAFEHTADGRDLAAAEGVWTFIERSLIDRKVGEWRWRIDPPNTTLPQVWPKAHFWKCPYHNGRALLEVLDRSERILAV